MLKNLGVWLSYHTHTHTQQRCRSACVCICPGAASLSCHLNSTNHSWFQRIIWPPRNERGGKNSFLCCSDDFEIIKTNSPIQNGAFLYALRSANPRLRDDFASQATAYARKSATHEEDLRLQVCVGWLWVFIVGCFEWRAVKLAGHKSTEGLRTR